MRGRMWQPLSALVASVHDARIRQTVQVNRISLPGSFRKTFPQKMFPGDKRTLAILFGQVMS